MLSVILLNMIMLKVITLSVVMPNIVILSVIMPNVISAVIMNVVMVNKYPSFECQNAECHYSEGIMLTVVLPNIFIPSVNAKCHYCCHNECCYG